VTGIAEATGDWLVVIPADLPLDLDDLSRYWEAARHADVVVGVRSTGVTCLGSDGRYRW
jgi:2-phospho-L-lactate guanylyltransferase (CobY/MobA/RfbA family)